MKAARDVRSRSPPSWRGADRGARADAARRRRSAAGEGGRGAAALPPRHRALQGRRPRRRRWWSSSAPTSSRRTTRFSTTSARSRISVTTMRPRFAISASTSARATTRSRSSASSEVARDIAELEHRVGRLEIEAVEEGTEVFDRRRADGNDAVARADPRQRRPAKGRRDRAQRRASHRVWSTSPGGEITRVSFPRLGPQPMADPAPTRATPAARGGEPAARAGQVCARRGGGRTASEPAVDSGRAESGARRDGGRAELRLPLEVVDA